MLDNIYKIETIRSEVQTKEMDNNIDIIEEIEKIQNGYIVCWLDYTVLFGKLQSGEIKFYDNASHDLNKYLQKLRAFNEKEEIYIWRSKDKFKLRYRKDDISEEEGEEIEYIDAKQIMYGSKFEDKGNFIEVSENRGIKYMVPKEFIGNNTVDDMNRHKKRLVLHTRNYIGYNEIGQAGFVDSRFLDISIYRGD